MESTRARKIVTGCAIAAGVALALLLAVGIGGYLAIRQVTGPLTYLGAAAALEKKALGTVEYTPPASGELTDRQLVAFLEVEQAVESRLGDRLADLRAKSEVLIRRSSEGDTPLPIRPTLDALGPVGRAFLDGKTAKIDACNHAGISLPEFEWTRQQLYHAAAIDAWQFDYSDVLRAVPDAGFTLHRLPHGTLAPPANRSLAAPHLEELRRWSVLAFFGL